MISTKILRELGSTADIVILFQISSRGEEDSITTLPPEDIRLLDAMNIKYYYIPKQDGESFYRAQLDKFRILSLIQYKRVLYMDGDLMPTTNYDFLFELSERGILKENFVIQGKREPANGGFFMLKPSMTYLKEIQQVIEKREESANKLRQKYGRIHDNSVKREHYKKSEGIMFPYFDHVKGWGHTIKPPDAWVTRRVSGTNWTFLAAFADQGLLYHYVKYVRQSVSIYTAHDIVENWSGSGNSYDTTNNTANINNTNETTIPVVNVQLETKLTKPFHNYTSQQNRTLGLCWIDCKILKHQKHLHHFTGRKKPWLRGPPADLVDININNKENSSVSNDDDSNSIQSLKIKSAEHYWFYTLMELNEKYKMNINFFDGSWHISQHPSLGLYPKEDTVLNANTNLLSKLIIPNSTNRK